MIDGMPHAEYETRHGGSPHETGSPVPVAGD
jgi:hypothetical protein